MTGSFNRKRKSMNIKRFFLSLLTCVMVGSMMGSTTSLWSGNQNFTDWSTVVNISGSKFQKVKAGNLVHFVMETRDGAQLQVSYGSSWTNLPDLSSRSVSGNYDMLVTQSMVSQLKQGIHVKGVNFTLTAVQLFAFDGSYTTESPEFFAWDDLFVSGGTKDDTWLSMKPYSGAGWYWAAAQDFSVYDSLQIKFQMPTDQPLQLQVLYSSSGVRRVTLPADTESYSLRLTTAMKAVYSVNLLAEQAQSVALASVNFVDKEGNIVPTAIEDMKLGGEDEDFYDLSGRRIVRQLGRGPAVVRRRLSGGTYQTRKVMLPSPLWRGVSAADGIDSQPCDPDANEETRALYAYLRNEVWGQRVMSGCQAEWNYNINDAKTIYEAGGKYPKVNIFDFQHFDQSWINYRSTVARDWHRAGGIVSFMWHIHMPCNVFCEQMSGWTAFYAYSNPPCHISPLRAATEGTLENRIFKKKLDGVASLLLYYQNQGIPILFRPLHEASGRWFWWGTDGAEAYRALWGYMQDYFMEKGVHNLIWIWTSEVNDPDWYPGDDRVDIIARDGYPEGNTTHLSQASDFRKLQQRYPNKMLCLPECNSVPSWENMQNDQALWLYVAPWCGGGAMGSGNDSDFWTDFLNNENIITR